jgi:hypothetical protein
MIRFGLSNTAYNSENEGTSYTYKWYAGASARGMDDSKSGRGLGSLMVYVTSLYEGTEYEGAPEYIL